MMTKVIKTQDCGERIAVDSVPIQNAIIIPDNATYGDIIKNLLNPYKICEYEYSVHIYMTEKDFWNAEYQMNCDTSLWNSPYQKEVEVWQ